MKNCPNVNTPEWKALADDETGVGPAEAMRDFMETGETRSVEVVKAKLAALKNDPIGSKKGVAELFESNPELANAVYSKILTNPQLSAEDLLSLLEKENIIEKDCTGGSKLKARKGLQTNFTKGGKWRLIKDLKGYPTHKEGGVDLTIGKDGVSIKNGNTEFTAKYGLVIPKN